MKRTELQEINYRLRQAYKANVQDLMAQVSTAKQVYKKVIRYKKEGWSTTRWHIVPPDTGEVPTFEEVYSSVDTTFHIVYSIVEGAEIPNFLLTGADYRRFTKACKARKEQLASIANTQERR